MFRSPPAARALFGAAALFLGLVAPALLPGPAAARTATRATPARVGPAVEEHILGNGMRVLLIPRHLAPTVACAWIAHVGSVNERPGITGISHLFEHMMFKGTHVIGTRNYALDDQLIAAQEVVMDSMRMEMSVLRDMQRRGRIDDMTRPENKTARMKALEVRFDSLVAAQRANMVKNEYDLVMSKNGVVGTNAFTAEDMTVYFDTTPANKLELWLWMQADRLQNRVFREFYSERDVVYEERRMRVESTPTGKFDESFNSVFWDSSPYSWPVIGWPSDVASITKADADDYYALFYAPQNLTCVMVGDFEPAQALALAKKYLGSIPRGARPAPEMITHEVPSLAEKRFHGEAEANPSVDIRWHTVAYLHKDGPTLEVISGLLNGATGRLQRSIVLDQGLATDTGASNEDRKYDGFFQISGEAKESHTPEEVEQAIYRELEKLQKAPVSAEELQKVKNRYLTSTYRGLTSNQAIMFRYAVADGSGDWREAERRDARIKAVTADDVQRAAQQYFTPERRAVSIMTRKDGTAPADPALAALPAEARPMVTQMLGKITSETDPAKLQQMMTRMDSMGGQAPPEMKPALDYLKAQIQARLDALGKK